MAQPQARVQVAPRALTQYANDEVGPRVSISGVATWGRNTNFPVILDETTTQASYTLSWQRSRHFFKFGGDVSHIAALSSFPVSFAGSFTFIRNNAYLLPAITLFSLAQVLLASTTMLALSSLSKSSRFVGVMYAGLMFFTAALFQALRGITGSSAFAWISPGSALEQLGDVIFRLEPRYELSPVLAAAVVVALIAGSAVVLARRIRGVEIVT